MTCPENPFDSNARKLVLRHMLEAKSGINFAPDTTPEMLKAGRTGPHTLQISKILRQHALLWAHDMREHEQLGVGMDGKAAWAAHMREAEAEVLRYMANHHLARAA